MSKIKVKATIVAENNVVASNSQSRTPVVTRVQLNNGKGYEFVNNLNEVRSILESGNYSIFVNYMRGKDTDAPFKKGQLCQTYREAIEYIASHPEEKYKVDLVLRNRQYSTDELEAIASTLDF